MNYALATNNIACYYHKIQDFDKMIFFYKEAIEKNCTIAMRNLGVYYRDMNNETEMLKYYNMAINNKCNISAVWIGIYYDKQKNYDLMFKYYLMVINNNNINLVSSKEIFLSIIKDTKDKFDIFSIDSKNISNILMIYIIRCLFKNDERFTTIETYIPSSIELYLKNIKDMNYKKKYDVDCPLCQEDIININNIVLRCGHLYCIDCLNKLIKSKINSMDIKLNCCYCDSFIC